MTNKDGEGRPSVTSDALLQRTEEAIRANRRLKLKELHQIIQEVSMTTLYEVVNVNEKNHGFWERQSILLLECMPPGTTINAAAYCQTLKCLRRAIQNKRRGMLTNGVRFLHDNARPHTALVTKALLKQFKWEVLDHPPYSP
ncbi:histone-lysine N-methyltransferase SETMAR [Trichonephila clavipes]|nr:histone-lysine N-methyltransferase SETMAR [Trichonephila clavipes]